MMKKNLTSLERNKNKRSKNNKINKKKFLQLLLSCMEQIFEDWIIIIKMKMKNKRSQNFILVKKLKNKCSKKQRIFAKEVALKV